MQVSVQFHSKQVSHEAKLAVLEESVRAYQDNKE